MEKIIIASDHGGIDLKQDLIEKLKVQYEIVDIGTYDKNSCDYPKYAKEVAKRIQSGEFEKGILICGTGVGMSICANRFKGIRAVCCSDTYSAKLSRQHNNSNVLCLGQRVLGFGLAYEIANVWLNGEFEAGRHLNRINMIDE